MRVWTYDSFTNIVGGGNPAGVVILTYEHLQADECLHKNECLQVNEELHETARELSDAEMLEIARRVGFSETAFVSKSDKADFKVRFFTPSDEVDLCGHATIAVFSHLFGTGKIGEGRFTQETKAGILGINIDHSGEVFMEQAVPVFSDIISKEEIADSLGIFVNDMPENLPVEIVSTGLRDIIIPVKSLDILRGIEPDFLKVKEISRKYQAVGYHIFTTEVENEIANANENATGNMSANANENATGNMSANVNESANKNASTNGYANEIKKRNIIAECRNLAPLYDIPEEAATGTANGALTGYLYKHSELLDEKKRLIPNEIYTYKQGATMGRPSEIKAIVEVFEGEIVDNKIMPGSKAKIKRIKIGGRAVLSGIMDV